MRVVDAHNDLLLELELRHDEARPFERYWLDQLVAGGVGLQVCPIFTATAPSLSHALRQVCAFYRAVDEHPEQVCAVRSAADLEPVRRGERLGLMLSMEGAEALGHDPRLIDVFHRLGVRMISFTHNRRNPFADGVGEPRPGGLSGRGQELLEEVVRRGMMLDLAHAAEPTFFDLLEGSGEAPVLVSHAGARTICDTPRNLSDEQVRAVADRGGVVGVMVLPFVVDPAAPTLERIVDHIDHIVGLVGIDHVGLGADFFAQVAAVLGEEGDWEVPGLRGPDGYPTLLAVLDRRGYSPTQIAQISGGNMMRLFERALGPAAALT